ncbi:MAG: hypothetical protein K6G13_07875 [Agathobacter sp.]|uniref:hypothetical protein n=1 Tax=Agathobacter sp. TaxID=2021311 RepID=UPI00258F872B|nr:hypothetical protein [Agathobacter sp.]MCR5677930.1 hypothetical protein [Agathobacter sp.]
MKKLRKQILCWGFIIILVSNCFACSTVKEEARSRTNSLYGSDVSETAMMEETENPDDYYIVQGHKIPKTKMDYSAIKQLQESCYFDWIQENDGTFRQIKLKLSVKKVYLTNEIEENKDEWNEIGLEDAQFNGNTCTNGKIGYADFQLENEENETVDFCASSIGFTGVGERNHLEALASEIGYFNYMGTIDNDHNAFLLKIEPGEKKDIRVGYFILEDYLDNCRDIYLDATKSNITNGKMKIYYPIPGVSKEGAGN